MDFLKWHDPHLLVKTYDQLYGYFGVKQFIKHFEGRFRLNKGILGQ